MVKKTKVDDFDSGEEFELKSEDYQKLFKDKKKELLLDNRRARVTDMSFYDWFSKTYKRDFKASDKAIHEAYHAGALDEIENNEYLLEHTELKMNHYKGKALKLADQVQILYSLLENVARKAEMPDALRKLIKKTFGEQ